MAGELPGRKGQGRVVLASGGWLWSQGERTGRGACMAERSGAAAVEHGFKFAIKTLLVLRPS